MGAVCQSQLSLPQWEVWLTVGGRAVQWCLANPLYCQRSINPRSMIKNIINQHMKINVKCLYSFIQTQGRKGKLHFAQIMFKHSLAASAILKRHFWEAVPDSVTELHKKKSVR